MNRRIVQMCLLLPISAASAADDANELAADFGSLGLSLWMADIRLSSGYGYGENLLLSEVAPQDSGYTFVEAEAFVMRPMPDLDTELLVTAFFDSKIMDGLEELDHESIGIFNTEFTKFMGEEQLASIGLEHVYAKQAFDSSFDEVEVHSQVIQTREPAAYVRWEANGLGLSWRSRIKYSDTNFDEEANDFDTIDYRLWTGRQLIGKWYTRFGIRYYDREYDERLARNLDGVKIPEELLKLSAKEFDLLLIRDFELRNFDGEFKVGVERLARRDRSEGYSDRNDWEGKLGIELESEDWEFELGFGFDRREYQNQIESDGALRLEENASWSVRIERIYNDKWSVFLYASSEREDTNMEFSSYDTKWITLGVRLPSLSY